MNSNVMFVRENDNFQIFSNKGSMKQLFSVVYDGVTQTVYKHWSKKGDEVFPAGKYAIDLEKTPLIVDEFSDSFMMKVDMKNVVFKRLDKKQ